MQILKRVRIALSLFVLFHVDVSVAAKPDWTLFLKRDAIESIEISPNGKYLALAERVGESTLVTIRDAASLQVLMQINPGNLGEVSRLNWLDDDRILIGANRVDAKYRIALVQPALYIVTRDGKSKYKLPANFLSTIKDDPDHLLVTDCSDWQKGGCIDEVRRAEIGHLSRLGDKIIAAPDVHSTLFADQQGQVRFAIAWSDKSQSKLHVHRDQSSGWTLINDSTESGVDSVPLGVDQTGNHAFLVTEHKTGTSSVERYEIATGKREEVYRNPDSDPVWSIYSFDGNVPLGAYYNATRPRPVIWNATHPDVPMLRQIYNAFPGNLVHVTSASNDRNLAVVKVGSDKDPGAFYLFDRAAKKAVLLARSRSWLSALPVSATKDIQFTARDGTKLHGLLTLPPDTVATSLPMVVIPHGGPYEMLDTWSFDEEANLLASQGLAVLRINFRGSGGYGRAFVEQGYRQWGRGMQDDISDATRWAIKEGIADAKRICLYGASYGGYAALMGAVREPDLYQCVAGYAAPYDLAKMYKWGSIRRSDLGMNYLERVLGKDKPELTERSPAQQAASIKVPVLLAHGKLDARVAVEHSRAMVKSLRKANAQVELVEYPNEGHGLNIEADQIDFYTRLLGFLDKHIGPQAAIAGH